MSFSLKKLVFTSFSTYFKDFDKKKLVFTSFSSYFNDFDEKKRVFTSFASYLMVFLKLWKMNDTKTLISCENNQKTGKTGKYQLFLIKIIKKTGKTGKYQLLNDFDKK